MLPLPEDLKHHFHHPAHVGPPKGGYEYEGEARHPACGDHVVIYLAVFEKRVREVGFKAMGCPASMAIAAAAVDLLPGMVKDRSLPDAMVDAYEGLHGPPLDLHRHGLHLVARAVKNAVAVAPANEN
ncbi:MAG: iron-sulfur cluster assembly scaffold protein [Planctomycetota bacterium]|nr:iron-sulfur cluster assembly scaffold protein [Planctomycetota bacterium]